jgi:peptidoglycan/LPS O-acetylase OafA/YrhL
MFPVILIFLKKVNPKISVVFISATIIYAITQFTLINLVNSDFYESAPSPSHDLIFYFPLSHFCSFLLGVAGAYFALKSDVYNKFSNNIFWSLGSMICLVFVFILLNNRGLTRSIGGNIIPLESSFLAPIFLVMILFSVNSGNILNKIFCLKPLIILGESSYAIYILQKPCFHLYKKFLWPFLGVSNDVTFYVYWLLLIVVSVITFYVYERPAKKAFLCVWEYTKDSLKKRACSEEIAAAPN